MDRSWADAAVAAAAAVAPADMELVGLLLYIKKQRDDEDAAEAQVQEEVLPTSVEALKKKYFDVYDKNPRGCCSNKKEWLINKIKEKQPMAVRSIVLERGDVVDAMRASCAAVPNPMEEANTNDAACAERCQDESRPCEACTFDNVEHVKRSRRKPTWNFNCAMCGRIHTTRQHELFIRRRQNMMAQK